MCFLILSSSLTALWSDKLFVMIPVLLHLLRSDLLPMMWSILEYIQCGAEKIVYSVDLGWSILYMSIRSARSISAFKSWKFLLIFCPVDLSNIDSRVLKSHTIIVWESKSRFR